MITFRLNGAARQADVPPETRLAEILREELAVTGAKIACGVGRCGACTLMMDGRIVNGCLVMAWQADGAEIVSPEGLDAIPESRLVKAALSEENAFQCGYCAPGFTMALTALFCENPGAGEEDIRDALEGNICRCTGYHSIIRGALAAADRIRAASGKE